MDDAAHPGEVTRVLGRLRAGAEDASDELFRLVHDELRRLAGVFMAKQAAGHTLQPTALLNETYLKMVGTGSQGWEDRAHFLNAAARAMRCVLVDHARARSRDKRGGKKSPVTLDENRHGTTDPAEEVVAVHDALERLERIDPERGRVVELRYFAGLEMAEIARLLNVTERTVYNHWRHARLWLYREMAS